MDANANPSSGASPFLANLPSRGLFSSTVIAPNPTRVYVCVRDTSPPEGQHIKTNQQNILIRSLTLRKQNYGSSKDGSDSSRKRTAEKVSDSKASAKKPNNQTNSRQEGSNSQTSNKEYQSLTVERLRVLLRAKGLSTKGKKEELIARLKDADGKHSLEGGTSAH